MPANQDIFLGMDLSLFRGSVSADGDPVFPTMDFLTDL